MCEYRNDFLGIEHDGRSLKSFGINPGGYVGFYDPKIGYMDTYTIEGDKNADRCMWFKEKAGGARRQEDTSGASKTGDMDK